MVGAVGFEPTTPGPKPGALPGCAMPDFLSFYCIAHRAVRVYSRLDVASRQHLVLKKK